MTVTTTPRIRFNRRPFDWRGALGSVWQAFCALVILFYVVFPIIWLIFTAFRNGVDVYSDRYLSPLTLDNFRTILVGEFSVVPEFFASLFIASMTVSVAIPFSVAAAYVFARYDFRGSQALLVAVLTTQFIPALMVAIPFYNLFRNTGIYDTPWALVVVYLSLAMPYSIWMMRGFIDSLPVEIEEAAVVDGCNEYQVLAYVTFPLVLPGIITSLVFSFILCWNEFTFALMLAGQRTVTLPIALTRTIGLQGIAWEQIAAIGMLVMIPMFVMSFSIRKYFIEGLTMGAVK
ncbi:MAG: carbohydrate ABC transporter permease [Anaerolineales bacterium]|nr:carbohydrate ABC transporter permease [Anaerolineales bacterium]